jgi:hypothetical protein
MAKAREQPIATAILGKSYKVRTYRIRSGLTEPVVSRSGPRVDMSNSKNPEPGTAESYPKRTDINPLLRPEVGE